MPILDCGHAEEGGQRVCPHLWANRHDASYRYFTGRGQEWELVCSTCQRSEQTERVTLCGKCFRALVSDTECVGRSGEPEILSRATSLYFRHRIVSWDFPWPIVDIQPIEVDECQHWLAWTGTELIRLDLDTKESLVLFRRPAAEVAGLERIHLAPSGRYAALVADRGQNGIVVDVFSDRVTMPLNRGDYHEEQSRFPVAFVTVGTRDLVIHSTAWNRLDVSDPMTGELLTPRELPTERNENYLDYFHGGLLISPDGRRILDDGWVWSPYGVVRSWSLTDWIGRHVWESENGPSVRNLCGRSYFWNGPMCWIDAHRVAIWGMGEDENNLIPAARIFDVITGEESHWFAGPEGEFIFDEVLFACSPSNGVTVWDITTGERLLHDPTTQPTRYHRSARTFLQFGSRSGFRLSQLVGQPLQSSRTARLVAAGIAQAGTFDELPILADALEEAGCEDTALLRHCRAGVRHGQECWAVQRVLEASE